MTYFSMPLWIGRQTAFRGQTLEWYQEGPFSTCLCGGQLDEGQNLRKELVMGLRSA